MISKRKAVIGGILVVVAAAALALVAACGRQDEETARGAVSTPDRSRVQFRIIDEKSGRPLADRSLTIHRMAYDVRFESGDDRTQLLSVRTDTNGVFCLEPAALLTKMTSPRVVIQPGAPYATIGLDLSADSVRIIRFRGGRGETRVEANMYYDLQRGVVRTVPLEGEPSEAPFTEVVLAAKRFVPGRGRK